MAKQPTFNVWALALCAAMATPGAGAESVAERLERGLYAEETSGDLTGAIEIYTGIVDDARAERPRIAQALYRLGVCYTKLGQQDRAAATFEKLLQQFADQPNWVTKTQQLLHEQGQLGVLLVPVPWSDGEVTRYAVKTPAGSTTGVAEYSVTQTATEEVPVWRIENYTVFPLENIQQFSAVETAQENAYPVRARLKNSLTGDFRVDYQPQQVHLTVDAKGAKSSRELPVKGAVYDNEQILNLLRRLPLSATYQTHLTVFTPATGVTNNVKLQATGTERVTVGAGTFDCYQVDMTFYGDGKPAQTHSAWVAVDRERHLVKYQNNHMTMELAEVRETPTHNSAGYQNPSLGLSLPVPNTWRTFDVTQMIGGQFDAFVQLLPPEMIANGMFVTKKVGAETIANVSVAEIVDGDLNALRGYFKDYRVRTGSRTDLKISGLAAQSFIADYHFQDQAMVEYRTYILGKSAIYWFVFRIEKGGFEQNHEQFRTLVAGLDVN